jgi:hypothetical protein
MKKLFFILLFISTTAFSQSRWYQSPEAEGIPFDPQTSNLTSFQVGPALRELSTALSTTVSPGLTWGGGGNIPTGTYLNNEGVPSNRAGRIVPATGAIIKMYVTCENVATFTLEIQKNVGGTFSVLSSQTFTNIRKEVRAVSIAVTQDDELALYLSSGSSKNLLAGLLIKGN